MARIRGYPLRARIVWRVKKGEAIIAQPPVALRVVCLAGALHPLGSNSWGMSRPGAAGLDEFHGLGILPGEFRCEMIICHAVRIAHRHRIDAEFRAGDVDLCNSKDPHRRFHAPELPHIFIKQAIRNAEVDDDSGSEPMS
jgi:hypothetical protein